MCDVGSENVTLILTNVGKQGEEGRRKHTILATKTFLQRFRFSIIWGLWGELCIFSEM